jgi:ribonuclease Z
MRVQFIGVGEAFDENLPNNSQILEWGSARLLIDCGYAVPHSLWKLHPDPDYLTGIYISHRHADHYFGLPSYLVRLAEDGRKESIDVLCPEGMEGVIIEMIDFAYQGIMKKLEFPIAFHEVKAEKKIIYNGAVLNFAPSSHPVKNFAISVQVDDKKYAYSGDGNFNDRTKKLYLSCSLLVHEAYSLDEDVPGHAKIPDLLSMAYEMGVERIALTHLQRQVRRMRMKEIQELISRSNVQVLIPEVGEIYEI